MFNTVAHAWDYRRWEHKAKTHFTVAVQRFIAVILKRN
jgi:hypothetical protein